MTQQQAPASPTCVHTVLPLPPYPKILLLSVSFLLSLTPTGMSPCLTHISINHTFQNLTHHSLCKEGLQALACIRNTWTICWQDPTSNVSDSTGLSRTGTCISNKFPADNDSAGPGTTSGEQRPYSTSWHCSSCWNVTSQPHSHSRHYSVSGHCLMLRLLSSFLQVCLSYLVRPSTRLDVLMFTCWVLICIFHLFMEVHHLPFNFPSTPPCGSL